MRIQNTVHLTTNQKKVIAKIVAAPTPTVAAEEINKNPNLIAARNLLMAMGVISVVNGEASLTEKGLAVAAQENLTDQSGGLTADGESHAYDGEKQEQQPPAAADSMSLESALSFPLIRKLLG